MSWYQYVAGWIIVNFTLALFLGLIALGLWLQGWLAGRQYYNADRNDPWGTIGGRLAVWMIRSDIGEDRGVEIHPDSDWFQELPNGERIGPPTPGRVSDGQSIPVLAWPLIGSPLTGRSREVNTGGHDEECGREPKRWPSDLVHGYAYCGMRARGMWFRGPIMHAVLLNWGTKW